MTATLRDGISAAHDHAMSLTASFRTLTTILQKSFEVERAIQLMHQLQFEVVGNDEIPRGAGDMSKIFDSLQSLAASSKSTKSHPIAPSTADRKSR